MTKNEKLNIRVHGKGSPTLLFVHGFCCSLDDWKAQIEALSPMFKCVALDLPGHGASGLPYAATMAALGSAVNVAKAQSGGGDVILIGHSLGCKVIREAYAESSKDVIGLVMIEGAFYRGEREPLLKKVNGLIDQEGFVAYLQRHFSDMFFENCDPQLRERVLTGISRMDPTFARDMYLEAVGWDPLRGEETLRQIDVPVLVLQTTYNDAQFKRRPLEAGMTTPFMDAVAELVPQSEGKVIPGYGHFAPIEAAEAVNQEIRDFVRRIAKS